MTTMFQKGAQDGLVKNPKPKFPDDYNYMKGFEIGKAEGEQLRAKPTIHQYMDTATENIEDLVERIVDSMAPESLEERQLLTNYLSGTLSIAFCRGITQDLKQAYANI